MRVPPNHSAKDNLISGHPDILSIDSYMSSNHSSFEHPSLFLLRDVYGKLKVYRYILLKQNSFACAPPVFAEPATLAVSVRGGYKQ